MRGIRLRYLMLTAGLSVLAVALAQGAYSFVVNGKPAKLETLEKNGKVFVEVNSFARSLGANVKFDAAKKTFTVSSGAASASDTNPAQGTTQLAGGAGEIGKTYTMGKRSPLNFTLRSAEFSVTRQTLKEVYAPKGNEKLLILRFTVQNPQKNDVGLDYGSFVLMVVDDQDVNVKFDSYFARDGQNDDLSIQLKPAQKIDVYAVGVVAAKAKIPKLIVQRSSESGAPVVRYDLSNKVKPLAAPFADPADSSGSTALEVVPGVAGTYFPAGIFDVKLENTIFSTDKMDTKAPAEGKRYLIATFSIRNGAALTEQSFDYGRFKFELTDAEGSRQTFNGWLIKLSRDEHAEGKLKPGEEAKFRVYFELPSDLAAKTVTVQETGGPSRTYSFDLSGTK